MDIDLLSRNPISAFILIISSLMIFGALFNRRVQKASEKMEQDKVRGIPGYANQKDVLSAYCLGCRKNLTLDERRIKKCRSCNVKLLVNPPFLIFTSIGYTLLLAIVALSWESDENSIAFFIFFLVALTMLFLGLSKNKYKCIEQ